MFMSDLVRDPQRSVFLCCSLYNNCLPFKPIMLSKCDKKFFFIIDNYQSTYLTSECPNPTTVRKCAKKKKAWYEFYMPSDLVWVEMASWWKTYEPRHQKTGLRCFRPGPTKTRLRNYWMRLETLNFRFRKWRDCTIRVAKTKTLISFPVTVKLICVFVFAYAKIRFSHVAAHIR